MRLPDWFRKHLGERVLVEVAGVPAQTWRVYLVGTEVVRLIQPSETKTIDELTVFYQGIARFANLSRGAAGDVVGACWDANTKRWIPLTRADREGQATAPAELPEVPDHLPEDIDEV